MRKAETTIIALIGLELIVAVISYIILPDTCAIRWHFDKRVDYEDRIRVFVLPLISALTAGISLSLSVIYKKHDPVNGEAVYRLALMLSFIIIVLTFAGLLMILAANL